MRILRTMQRLVAALPWKYGDHVRETAITIAPDAVYAQCVPDGRGQKAIGNVQR